jgi:prephenate dehydratase/chorismate mutase
MTLDDARARIEALRVELEAADGALVEALGRRSRIVETIAAVKQQAGADLRDPERERAVLERAEAAARAERLDPYFVNRLFREIIDHAIRSQQARLATGSLGEPGRAILVGHPAPEGGPSHLAAQRHFSPWHAQTAYRACPSTRETLQALRDRDLDYAVVPVENTSSGSITEVYDLLTALDLSLIGEEIVDERGGAGSSTRFAVVADEALECDLRITCKTSVMFVTRHEKGALVNCLNLLAERGLNLTKLESRPRPGSPWEYQFYVDFEGNRGDPRVQDALRELAARTFFLKVFGSYPARTTSEARVGQARV